MYRLSFPQHLRKDYNLDGTPPEIINPYIQGLAGFIKHCYIKIERDRYQKEKNYFPDMIRDYVKQYKTHKFKANSKFCGCRELLLYGYIHGVESLVHLPYGIPDGIFNICGLYFGMKCNLLSYNWGLKLGEIAALFERLSGIPKQFMCKDSYYTEGKQKFYKSLPKLYIHSSNFT